ncbi:LOW QUALITY PROTEIN: cell adhesion molecule-related/down-regulated by oncogenes [Osmerus mordax]|uniref:LOW QUALITY PROTEIN: cell adhesion molecule-related/down-regulated by oncogenes n=1 Tax=Osmerus mordax TaxID=8014 RepID=UPI00350F8883
MAAGQTLSGGLRPPGPQPWLPTSNPGIKGCLDYCRRKGGGGAAGGGVASLSFRAEPVSVVQSQGSEVHLRCSARPSSARVSWRFRGLPLEPAALPGLEITQTSLSLSSLQHSHEGLYQCVAHTDSGAIASRLARVAIADIAEYSETRRRSLVVQDGSSVVIECPLPQSTPPALPRLRARGEKIEVSTEDYLVLPSGNLQIVSVSPKHQGMYKCGAYNPVTGETRMESHGTKLTVKHWDTTTVQIVYPHHPQDTDGGTVQVAHPWSVWCQGAPPPKAHWLKDGHEVALGSGRKQRHNNLVLVSVKSSDAGIYQCSVQTEVGTLFSVNYTVNVLERASVVRGLTDQSVPPGSSTHFNCLAKGNPTPNVTWLFNTEPITPSNRFQISGSSLRIIDVTPQEEGVYQCLSDNGIGSAQSAGMLTVQSATAPAPSLRVSFVQAVRDKPPDRGMLGVAVQGYDEDQTTQLHYAGTTLTGPIATHPRPAPPAPCRPKPGPPVTARPHLTMSRPGSSSLYIQAVTRAHAGTYICQASNELGSVRAEAVLSSQRVARDTMSSNQHLNMSVIPTPPLASTKQKQASCVRRGLFRCYTKTNGTFSGGTLPLMHRVAPCQQDGLEMVPLGQASSHCQRPDSQQLLPGDADPDPEAGEQPAEDRASSHSLSQLSCCQVGVHETSSRENTVEEDPQCVDSDGPVVCWESLGLSLPDLDCKEKRGWISNSSLAGDLIQPSPQET